MYTAPAGPPLGKDHMTVMRAYSQAQPRIGAKPMRAQGPKARCVYAGDQHAVIGPAYTVHVLTRSSWILPMRYMSCWSMSVLLSLTAAGASTSRTIMSLFFGCSVIASMFGIWRSLPRGTLDSRYKLGYQARCSLANSVR